MNTSGLDYFDIYSKCLTDIYGYKEDDVCNPIKVEQIINDLRQDWYFSEYYQILIDNHIPTPRSEFIVVNDLFQNYKKVDRLIKHFSHSQVFARTDLCSSKPDKPFHNSEDIICSFKNSWRTKDYLKNPNGIVVLREYINDISDYYEFRCYVHNKQFRALSSCQPVDCHFKILHYLDKIKNLVQKIIFYTEYDMCSIDIIIHYYDIKKDILTIEINTPVYLCATSGLFDLTNINDVDILIGKFNPEYICYPVVRIEYDA
jgi:hypothetical protein